MKLGFEMRGDTFLSDAMPNAVRAAPESMGVCVFLVAFSVLFIFSRVALSGVGMIPGMQYRLAYDLIFS